jgi:GNAT superfamily N-acetyltransferase
VEIREVHGYEALGQWAAVRNSIFRLDPESAQVLALVRAREVGHTNLLAVVNGEPVGVAMIPDDPGTRASTHAYVEVGVVPGHRGRGVGSALFHDVSQRVSNRGHEGLECEASAEDTATLDWLGRRGFREQRRHPQLVIGPDDPLAEAPVPDGVGLHAFGSRPDLIEGMFRVAQAIYPRFPSPRDGQAATFADWQVYELGDEDVDVELSLVAERDGDVQGYSMLTTPAGLDDAWHRVTCVLPTAGEELGAALVREQVARARAAGRKRVVSWALTPWTARVVAQLGFSAGEESVTLRGPLL